MKRSFAILLWLILAISISGGIGSFNIPKFLRLTKHTTQGTATVTEVTISNHNTVRYQYTVNDHIYYGQTQSGSPNPSAKVLHSGDSIIVFYDSTTPTLSVLTYPKELLLNEITSVGLATIIFSFLIIFGIIRAFNRNRKK